MELCKYIFLHALSISIAPPPSPPIQCLPATAWPAIALSCTIGLDLIISSSMGSPVGSFVLSRVDSIEFTQVGFSPGRKDWGVLVCPWSASVPNQLGHFTTSKPPPPTKKKQKAHNLSLRREDM